MKKKVERMSQMALRSLKTTEDMIPFLSSLSGMAYSSLALIENERHVRNEREGGAVRSVPCH